MYGDAWYTGEDTRVSDGIVYRRLPHSLYSLENPPNRNVVQTLFHNCNLDQHFKAVYFQDKERLYSFRSIASLLPAYVRLYPISMTDEMTEEEKKDVLSKAFFGSDDVKRPIQPIVFVPESLYDILVTPLVKIEFKSLRDLALQHMRKIKASDLNDASECRALFGDNIWVHDSHVVSKRAAQAKFYNSDDYGPYYAAEFNTDWRAININRPNVQKVCIFGMPEERIQEFKKAHKEIKFVDSNTVFLMSGSTFKKAAFMAHSSVRDWAA